MDEQISLPPASIALAKQVAHEIWGKYDDEHGYRSDKQDGNARVSAENPENIWFFWNQFDDTNQREFLFRVTDLTNDNVLGAAELEMWCHEQYDRGQTARNRLRERGIEL